MNKEVLELFSGIKYCPICGSHTNHYLKRVPTRFADGIRYSEQWFCSGCERE